MYFFYRNKILRKTYSLRLISWEEKEKKKKLIIQTIYWFLLLSLYAYIYIYILYLRKYRNFAIKRNISSIETSRWTSFYLIYWYIPSAQDAMNFPLLEKFISRTGPVCPFSAPTTQECVNSCCVSRLFLFLARLLPPPAAPIGPLAESLGSSNFTLSDSVTSERINILFVTVHRCERT